MIDLNPEQDSFIIIKFHGKLSSAFEIYPANVSPVQMLMIGEILKLQGQSTLQSEAIRQAIRDVQAEAKTPQQEPDLYVARGRILKPNA